jgi:hypothetical protein
VRQRNLERYRSNTDKAINLAKLLSQTLNHFFPDLRQRLAEIADPRTSSVYGIDEIIFAAIAIFLLKEGSRNQMNNSRRDKQMQRNFHSLFGFRLPHMDTVDDVLRDLEVEELENLRVAMVRLLLDKKLLRPMRLDNKWHLVAVDGTGVMKANEADEGTLAKISTLTGTTSFTRQVLEAKIIVPGGFAISIASEWLASDLNDNGTKEDCELNAFNRLAAKIATYFPKLPICILADGLYPGEPFFNICKQNNWRFCVVLKDKKLVTVWNIVDTQLEESESSGEIKNMILGDETTIEWVNGISYRQQIVAWLQCVERNGQTQRHFVFLTDLVIDQHTAAELIEIGRSRWRLEDAFNTQKNRGYTLGHKHSRVSFLATKNYYVAMQIAHMINQLMERSQHLRRMIDHSKETISHLWKLIVGALTWVSDETIFSQPYRRTQYRFE